jgi:DNA modification methylase
MDERKIEIAGQTIYNMDCFNAFELIEDKSIQLVFTSPPYNLGGFHSDSLKRSYSGYKDKLPEEKYRSFIKNAIKECYRVLKDNGSFFLNIKTRIIDGEAIPPYWVLEDNPFLLKQEIIWNYPSTANVDKVRFYPLFEYIYWFIKDKGNFFFNEEWAIIGNIWRISHITDRNEVKITNSDGMEIKHPAPFPTQLAQTVILAMTGENEGENEVLDPFLGSGTTLKVCRKYNRKGIGFEKYYNEYQEIIERRILSDEFPEKSLLDMKDKNKIFKAKFKKIDKFY